MTNFKDFSVVFLSISSFLFPILDSLFTNSITSCEGDGNTVPTQRPRLNPSDLAGDPSGYAPDSPARNLLVQFSEV